MGRRSPIAFLSAQWDNLFSRLHNQAVHEKTNKAISPPAGHILQWFRDVLWFQKNSMNNRGFRADQTFSKKRKIIFQIFDCHFLIRSSISNADSGFLWTQQISRFPQFGVVSEYVGVLRIKHWTLKPPFFAIILNLFAFWSLLPAIKHCDAVRDYAEHPGGLFFGVENEVGGNVCEALLEPIPVAPPPHAAPLKF